MSVVFMGADWSAGSDKTARVLVERRPDGTIRILAIKTTE